MQSPHLYSPVRYMNSDTADQQASRPMHSHLGGAEKGMHNFMRPEQGRYASVIS